MYAQSLSNRLLDGLVPFGSPLSQVDHAELAPLPIAVLAHARKVKAITFGPRLLQVTWHGYVDDEVVIAAWHVRDRRAVVATNNSIRVLNARDLYDLLNRMRPK